MDLMKTLSQHITNDHVQQISQQIGADQSSTNQAVKAAIPVLISAIANHASQPGGAEVLQNTLQNHDGGILNDLMGYLRNSAGSNPGGGILGQVLGSQQGAIQDAISRKTGLDPNSAGQLLSVLAPVVMGALAKAQNQNGFDPGALSGYLNQQSQQAQSSHPQITDILGGIAKNIFGK